MARFRTSPRPDMPFLDHLEELRWRIFYVLIALAVGTIFGFLIVYYLGVMEILIRPIEPMLPEGGLTEGGLAYFSPATPFFVTMKLSLVVGVILAMPVIVYQIWAFLSPGLNPNEKRIIIPALYFGVLLFAGGVAMAYYMVLPLALVFLAGFQEQFLVAVIEVNEYLAFVTRVLLAFGVAFELPIVVLILSVLGLITPTFMREKRRHAIVLITITASLLTPGDLASTFLMMGPLWILYELSILISAAIHRRRDSEEEPSILAPSEDPPDGAVGAPGP